MSAAGRMKRYSNVPRPDSIAAPEIMRLRRATVEHPFGTIKSWMGSTHFLTKTLPRVRAEMSLHVLAYNMKRAINLIGTERLVAAIRA